MVQRDEYIEKVISKNDAAQHSVQRIGGCARLEGTGFQPANR